MLRVVASGDDDILANARDVAFDVVECLYHVQLLSCCTTGPTANADTSWLAAILFTGRLRVRASVRDCIPVLKVCDHDIIEIRLWEFHQIYN